MALRQSEAVTLGVASSLRVTLAQLEGVPEGAPLAEAVLPSDAVTLPEPLGDGSGVALSEGVGECSPEALAAWLSVTLRVVDVECDALPDQASLPLPCALALGEGTKLALAAPLSLALAPVLAVALRHSEAVPLGEAASLALPQLEAVGEGAPLGEAS